MVLCLQFWLSSASFQQRNKCRTSRTFTPFINRPAKEAIRFTRIQQQDCLYLQKSLTRNVGNAAAPAVAIAPLIMRMSRMIRRLCLNWQQFDLLFSVLSVLLYVQSHNLSETEKHTMQKKLNILGGMFLDGGLLQLYSCLKLQALYIQLAVAAPFWPAGWLQHYSEDRVRHGLTDRCIF